MNWNDYPDREIAERVCTDKELAVLKLKQQGYGRRLGSLHLDISDETWRTRMRNALRKIRHEKERAQEAA